MRKNTTLMKTASDMYGAQMGWTVWFLGIMIIIHVIRVINVHFFNGNDMDDFYMAITISANIYMFVIGIISIYFLPHFVQLGVPRKHYFRGTILALLGLVISIPLISFIVSWLNRIIVFNLLKVEFAGTDLNAVFTEIVGGDSLSDTFGQLLGQSIQMFILTPYIDPSNHWLLAIVTFALNLFTYYLFGWVIAATYYRLGNIVGLLSIFFVIVLVILKDAFLRSMLDLPTYGWFAGVESLSKGLTVSLFVLLIVLSLGIIYSLLKKVPIKL